MKKVFILKPNENWICDQIADDFNNYCRENTASLNECDIIWLLADWCYDQIPAGMLNNKKVVTTIHHIVPEKFDDKALRTFRHRDSYTDTYHVPNIHTQNFIKQYTDKPTHLIPYWGNHKLWKPIHETARHEVRRQIGATENTFVVFSAQRDTEGSDLRSPKLEKGPDLLADYLEKLNEQKEDLLIVLAGWRRQYILSRLNTAKIRCYFEQLPKQERINQLYNAADLYPITARYEGGPQSLIECALTGLKVVSRHVGMAEMMLPENAINDDVSLAQPVVPSLLPEQRMPDCFARYIELFESL